MTTAIGLITRLGWWFNYELYKLVHQEMERQVIGKSESSWKVKKCVTE